MLRQDLYSKYKIDETDKYSTRTKQRTNTVKKKVFFFLINKRKRRTNDLPVSGRDTAASSTTASASAASSTPATTTTTTPAASTSPVAKLGSDVRRLQVVVDRHLHVLVAEETRQRLGRAVRQRCLLLVVVDAEQRTLALLARVLAHLKFVYSLRKRKHTRTPSGNHI